MSGDMMQTIQRLEREVAQLKTQMRRPDRVAAAWMAMQSMPLLFPNLRGVWLMNQWAVGTIYDATSQGRNMTIGGTISFVQHKNLFRTLSLNGAGYLSRASESGLEITGSMSVVAWTYKDVAASQFPIFTKSQNFGATANDAFYLTHGTSDNSNLTVISGTTNYSIAKSAPVADWVYSYGAYIPSTSLTLYMGTRDGWESPAVNSTSIPASINAATSTDVVIGGTHGGLNLGSGDYGIVAVMASAGNEGLAHTFFEHTKGLFF